MKELLGILCATVSIVSAGVAMYYANKCSELEEEKTKKNDPEKDDSPEFDCSNCCDDCYECYGDVNMDDLDDVELDSELPTEKEEDVDIKSVIPDLDIEVEDDTVPKKDESKSPEEEDKEDDNF
jgi:hypothetical protein